MKEQSKVATTTTTTEKPEGFKLFADLSATVAACAAKVPDSKNGRSNVAKMSLEQTRAFFAGLSGVKEDIRKLAENGFKKDTSGLNNYKATICNAMLVGFLFKDEKQARNAIACFNNANHMKDGTERLGFVYGTINGSFGVIEKKIL